VSRKKLKFAKKQTQKFLSSLAFDSSTGALAVTAEVGAIPYYDTRAKELVLSLDSMPSDERQAARVQIIQLLTMSSIEYGQIKDKREARGQNPEVNYPVP
jgi:hypothetical protein